MRPTLAEDVRCGHAALGLARPLWFPIDDTMKRTNYQRLGPFFATLLLVSFSTSSSRAEDPQPIIRFVRNPDPAPEFSLTGLDGQPVTLAGSKGKVILLNFWATWCGPCRAEIPDLVELQNKYKEHLQILGLVVDDDDQDAIKDFADK